MSPDQILKRIDLLSCHADVKDAIRDCDCVEWEPGDSQTMDVHVNCNTTHSGISFVIGLPPAVLIAGLRAMERELERMADVREAA